MLKEKISYGLGDFACNLFFTMFTSYIMYYYTDVAGIGLFAAGAIMAVSRVVDAFADLVIGRLVDRTKSRFGKARPYILWMLIPMCVMNVLVYSVPEVSGSARTTYAAVTYILFSVTYTFLNMPYTSMLASVCTEDKERLSFNMFKNILANSGAFIVSGLTLTLVHFFGGQNTGRGFTCTAALFSCIAAVMLFICFKNTKEKVVCDSSDMSFRASVGVLVKNRPWIRLCLICLLTFITLIARNQAMIYYAKYYLNRENLSSVLLGITNMIALPCALSIPVIAGKFGKKKVLAVSHMLICLSAFGIFIFDTNIPVIIGMTCIGSAGFSLATSLPFVMLADTIDYAQSQWGIRPQGLMTSIFGYMAKLGIALAGIFVSAILSFGGYVDNTAQLPSALNAIRFAYVGIPMMLSAVTSVLSLKMKDVSAV